MSPIDRVSRSSASRHPPPAGGRGWIGVTRRGALAIGMAAIVAMAAGCGGDDYGDYYDCNPNFHPAVAVTFYDARTSQVIVVSARGTAYDGRVVEEMTSPDPNYSIDGRTSVLEAGFGRPGIYDVSVVTGSGERFDWPGVRVSGDACGPFTVQLQAPVQFF